MRMLFHIITNTYLPYSRKFAVSLNKVSQSCHVYFLGSCAMLRRTASFALPLFMALGGAAFWGTAQAEMPNLPQGPRPHQGRNRFMPGVDRPEVTRTDSRASNSYCTVSPFSLVQFANKEYFDFPALIHYVTEPACSQMDSQNVLRAMGLGVHWTRLGTLDLNTLVENFSLSPLDGTYRLDRYLQKEVPTVLREAPVDRASQFSILGQLAILSPASAVEALSYLAREELLKKSTASGKSIMEPAKAVLGEEEIGALANTMLKLGADRPRIASAIASDFKQDALLGRGYGLGQRLSALLQTARTEQRLLPVFTLSASAVAQGVKQAHSLYSQEQKDQVVKGVFATIALGAASPAEFLVGIESLNEALTYVIQGVPLDQTALAKLWREVVTVLAKNPSQQALAETLALSLSRIEVLLPPADRELLFGSAEKYPVIADAIQVEQLAAWKHLNDNFLAGKVPSRQFDAFKGRYIDPFTKSILNLGPQLVTYHWLSCALEQQLLSDDIIEKDLSRFVLALLSEREHLAEMAQMDNGLEPVMAAMAEDLKIVWMLSAVHIPALFGWLERMTTPVVAKN